MLGCGYDMKFPYALRPKFINFSLRNLGGSAKGCSLILILHGGGAESQVRRGRRGP